ncbi:MAG: cysteine-rich CWC family protein [Gammaproteobacteria bacterium]|nr:cysteine-rich CWC family protein [Gammaproteobacteria bacterium]
MADADALPTQGCARCGASFACGMSTGRCWCAQLPPLPALPVHVQPSCLCPACLRELTLRARPGERERNGPRR